MIEGVIPIKTVSNAREHHFAKARRVRLERQAGYFCTPLEVVHLPLPISVSLTRISAGELDDDNLRVSLKGVRDGVADRLGVNDNDKRVTWQYAQEKCKRGNYGVRVSI